MTFQVRASNLGFSESGTENRSELPRISSRVAPTGPGKRNVFYEPDGDSHVAGAHLAEDAFKNRSQSKTLKHSVICGRISGQSWGTSVDWSCQTKGHDTSRATMPNLIAPQVCVPVVFLVTSPSIPPACSFFGQESSWFTSLTKGLRHLYIGSALINKSQS